MMFPHHKEPLVLKENVREVTRKKKDKPPQVEDTRNSVDIPSVPSISPSAAALSLNQHSVPKSVQDHT
jgi:hypothetical protein